VIRYPSLEQVLRANDRHGGGAGVRDLTLVEAALARPQQGFGDVEVHPSLFAKAGALLHGLVSTQGFWDGNKRTGWAVTNMFLRANGHTIRDMAEIEAEAFVMAVAVSAWSDRTVERASEWLQVRALGMAPIASDDVQVVLEYRAQTFMALGIDPFVVVKMQVVNMQKLLDEGIDAVRSDLNIALAPGDAVSLAQVVHKVVEGLPARKSRA
jgi:prophage maintenance system killer protein